MTLRVSLRLLVFCFLLFTLLLTGCAGKQSGSSGSPVLKVGVTPNYPPIIYKQNGQIVGAEAEFARKLARRLNYELRFVEMPFDKLLPALDEGKINIVMSGMTVTALREPLAQFCNPYAVTGQALLVRSADLWNFAYPEVIYMIKTRIGVEKGSIGDILAQRKCPQATIITYSSPEEAARALKAGRVDVVLADAPVISRIAAASQGAGISPVRKLLTQEDLAWAVQRGDLKLLNAANAALQQWRNDGTLSSILNSYMPLSQ